MQAGLNWVLVKITDKKPKGIISESMAVPCLEGVLESVGHCDPQLKDPNLKIGCTVILEPNSRGIPMEEGLVAFRRTQILAIQK